MKTIRKITVLLLILTALFSVTANAATSEDVPERTMIDTKIIAGQESSPEFPNSGKVVTETIINHEGDYIFGPYVSVEVKCPETIKVGEPVLVHFETFLGDSENYAGLKLKSGNANIVPLTSAVYTYLKGSNPTGWFVEYNMKPIKNDGDSVEMASKESDRAECYYTLIPTSEGKLTFDIYAHDGDTLLTKTFNIEVRGLAVNSKNVTPQIIANAGCTIITPNFIYDKSGYRFNVQIIGDIEDISGTYGIHPVDIADLDFLDRFWLSDNNLCEFENYMKANVTNPLGSFSMIATYPNHKNENGLNYKNLVDPTFKVVIIIDESKLWSLK